MSMQRSPVNLFVLVPVVLCLNVDIGLAQFQVNNPFVAPTVPNPSAIFGNNFNRFSPRAGGSIPAIHQGMPDGRIGSLNQLFAPTPVVPQFGPPLPYRVIRQNEYFANPGSSLFLPGSVVSQFQSNVPPMANPTPLDFGNGRIINGPLGPVDLNVVFPTPNGNIGVPPVQMPLR